MRDIIMKKTLRFPTLCLGVGTGHGCKTLTVNVELRKVGEKLNWETNELEEMIELSICGSGMGYGGQCLDHFKEEAEQYMIDDNRRELFRRVHDIWDKYHLNTMKAGTKWQTEEFANRLANSNELREIHKIKDTYKMITEMESLSDIKEDNNFLVKQTNVNGQVEMVPYKYGHAWLADPLPEEILAEVLSWKDIEDYSREELSRIRRKLIREYNITRK